MLQIGDIVQLNSGGLKMEVVSIDGPIAVVKYEIDEQYPVSCLRKVFGQDREFMGKKELLGKARAMAQKWVNQVAATSPSPKPRRIGKGGAEKGGGKRTVHSAQSLACCAGHLRAALPQATHSARKTSDSPAPEMAAGLLHTSSSHARTSRPSRGSWTGSVPNSGQINRISSKRHFAVANC